MEKWTITSGLHFVASMDGCIWVLNLSIMMRYYMEKVKASVGRRRHGNIPPFILLHGQNINDSMSIYVCVVQKFQSELDRGE
jgi:hypothetical protein